MYIDSHCHLDRVDLGPYDGQFPRLIEATRAAQVEHILCVCIDLEHYPEMVSLVEPYAEVSLSVGVHPNEADRREPEVEELVRLSAHPRNVAIGETGLDYYRSDSALPWQQQRFRTHIRAAREVGKPLIIHTRDAREDTLRILREERAHEVGGVMHCFTETWEMASAAMDMGFYVSFSGIVTFRNAAELREVATRVPLERLLIETDAPYLAPVPHRGRTNQPAWVTFTAQFIADLRDTPIGMIAEATWSNAERAFPRIVS